MMLVTQVGEFELFEPKPAGADGWRNLRLIRTGNGKFRKRSWWLGWNGERMSDSRDAKILKEHYPEVYAAVIEVVQ
jgi:hypothetical protein